MVKKKMKVEGKYIEADAEGEALTPDEEQVEAAVWVVMKERPGLPTRVHGPYTADEAQKAAVRLRGKAMLLRP